MYILEDVTTFSVRTVHKHAKMKEEEAQEISLNVPLMKWG